MLTGLCCEQYERFARSVVAGYLIFEPNIVPADPASEAGVDERHVFLKANDPHSSPGSAPAPPMA